MITIILAGYALSNSFTGPLLFGPNQLIRAAVFAEANLGQSGYTTVYRNPNGPGPDGKKFVGRRNYTLVSGMVIDQSKGFEI